MATDFTPYSALTGGLLIGLAATLLYAALGRSASVGAILDHALEHRSGRRWRLAFLLSMVAAAGAWSLLGPGVAAPRDGFPVPWPIGAGLLVGFGSRMAGDCSGGRGIFGMTELSRRSLVAVAVFVAAATATVFVLRHVLGGLA